MVVRITAVPRQGYENSGLQAAHFASAFHDRVWAIPSRGNAVNSAESVKFSLLDSPWTKNIIPPKALRALFAIEVFARLLFQHSQLVFVHSFVLAVPLFFLHHPFVIVIHGSDRKYLRTRWGRFIASRAVRVFGVGFSESINGSAVIELPNIFEPINSSFGNVAVKYDAAFVLRNAAVKNPYYPIRLAGGLPADRHVNFAVVGISREELTDAEVSEVERLRAAGKKITYFGRVNPETVGSIVSQARALVIPSHSEGIPKVMLESLALGVKVIVNSAITLPINLQDMTLSADLDDFQQMGVLIGAESDADERSRAMDFAIQYRENSMQQIYGAYESIYRIYDPEYGK
jgi:hypothetical protein